MFKFEDMLGSEVWLDPAEVSAVMHVNDSVLQEHFVSVYVKGIANSFDYAPKDADDCRQFMLNLFKAMGQEYKYEG